MFSLLVSIRAAREAVSPTQNIFQNITGINKLENAFNFAYQNGGSTLWSKVLILFNDSEEAIRYCSLGSEVSRKSKAKLEEPPPYPSKGDSSSNPCLPLTSLYESEQDA